MKFLADENLDYRIFKGLQLVLPELDLVRVQDTEIYQASDPEVLEWAARENRIVITHDVQTMTRFAYERIKNGLSTPGVIEIRKVTPIGQVIEELSVMIGAGSPDDFENQVRYIPIT